MKPRIPAVAWIALLFLTGSLVTVFGLAGLFLIPITFLLLYFAWKAIRTQPERYRGASFVRVMLALAVFAAIVSGTVVLPEFLRILSRA